MADRSWYAAVHRLVRDFGQPRFKKYLRQAADFKRIHHAWHGWLVFACSHNIRSIFSFWIENFSAVQPFPPHQPDRHLELFSPALQTLL